MQSTTKRFAVAAVAAVAMLGAACSSSGGDVTGTVHDYGIELDATSVSAGSVTFSITNEGPSEHEFLVVRSDAAPDSFTPTAEGIVDEALLDVVDEIPEWAAGETQELTLDLAAGSYIIMCNIEGHYQAGMHIGFTVE